MKNFVQKHVRKIAEKLSQIRKKSQTFKKKTIQ